MISSELLDRALEQITKRTANYEYFFEKLDSPEWIKPLSKKGMFQEPPPLQREGDSISFPPWPESRYLARMAPLASGTVLKVALRVPETENVRVHEDLADAACSMPPKLATRWAKKEAGWVSSQERLYLLLPDKLAALVTHLARGGQVESALKLARQLLAVLPGPGACEDVTGYDEYRLPPEPRARFDHWTYERVLRELLSDSDPTWGARVLSLLCCLLEDAIRLSQRREQEKALQDYSYVWRPAIEDHPQNIQRGIKQALISAIRDLVEQQARTDPGLVPKLVGQLETRSLRVFRRLALHLLGRVSAVAPHLVAARLTDPSLFDDVGVRHEYYLLMKASFGNLSAPDQKKILALINAGPMRDNFEKSLQRYTGALPAEKDYQRYANVWRRDKLAAISDALAPEWKKRYKQLVAELGPPRHPDFPVHMNVGFGTSPSPKTREELSSMTTEELVQFLANWRWRPDDWAGPSPDSLGREIKTLAASQPERYASKADSFQELDPTYVRALIEGLDDAVRQKLRFSWPPVLRLCARSVRQERNIPSRTREATEHGDLDPDWGWTRCAIARLISDGLTKGADEIPSALRAEVWQVLDPLTDDPEPTPEYEAMYGGSNMHPPTLSLNTVRGCAMHAVMRYALWTRRHLEALPDGKERVARGLDEMPEIRDALNAHLDPVQDPAVAIRAVYGQWFPTLLFLDREWTVGHVREIFPADETMRDAAWQSYIGFWSADKKVFEVLKEDYRRAVECIGADRGERALLRNPDERLAEHLMALYCQEAISLEERDGLLAAFYARAPDRVRAQALRSVGLGLGHTDEQIPEAVLQRLKDLWECRLSAGRAKPDAHQEELAAFGWWFISGKFGDEWVLAQLEGALSIAKKAEPDDPVAEQLAKLSRGMPLQAVRCLSLLAEGDEANWGTFLRRDHAKTILSNALESEDSSARDAASNLANILIARGHRHLRDLISTETR